MKQTVYIYSYFQSFWLVSFRLQYALDIKKKGKKDSGGGRGIGIGFAWDLINTDCSQEIRTWHEEMFMYLNQWRFFYEFQ